MYQQLSIFDYSKTRKKILLVNVDSRWNMAIRKMYAYYHKDNDVTMIDLGFSGYPHKRTKEIDASEYDEVYISNIFDVNKDRVTVINCDSVTYGGIGSNFPERQLPLEIEMSEPFYFPDEDTSYGFITRGCIRNCWFCKVPKYEGKIKEYNKIENIVKHKKFIALDNNIFAYKGCCDVFQWLIDHDIACDFNQGLDFRLANDENMSLLSQLKYLKTEYIFAFDDPRFQKALDKKIVLIKKYIPKDWRLKFYIYIHPSMSTGLMIQRAEWCRKNKCLPYIMRDAECYTDKNKNFYTDYASYCNQAGFFKNMTFEEFLIKREKAKSINEDRRKKTLEIYQEALKECYIS